MMNLGQRSFVTAIIIAALVAWPPFTPYGRDAGAALTPAAQDSTAHPRPRSSEEVEDDEVVRVDTALVNIHASVLDRQGNFVPRLTKEDFSIYENGVEQQIVHFAPAERPFTVFLVLDTSQSTLFSLADMQEAAVAFVEQLRPQDRVVVVSFSNVLSVKNEATNDRDVLRDAIRRTTTGGGTSLYPAVDYIIKHLLRPTPGRKAVVLFTDGVDSGAANRIDTPGRPTFESTVHDAEESEALIYTVRYETLHQMLALSPSYAHNQVRRGYRTAGKYLEALASRTGGQVLKADSLPVLRSAFSRIAEVLRWQYSLGYYPNEAAAKGERRLLRLKVKRPDVAVRARDSYVRQ